MKKKTTMFFKTIRKIRFVSSKNMFESEFDLVKRKYPFSMVFILSNISST